MKECIAQWMSTIIGSLYLKKTWLDSKPTIRTQRIHLRWELLHLLIEDQERS